VARATRRLIVAANNLRIIYQNVVDVSTTTLTASSTASAGTPASNMKLDSKSLVWRSGSVNTSAVNGLYTAKANLVISLASANIGGVILPFCKPPPSLLQPLTYKLLVNLLGIRNENMVRICE
jgi:hypothetical protein